MNRYFSVVRVDIHGFLMRCLSYKSFWEGMHWYRYDAYLDFFWSCEIWIHNMECTWTVNPRASASGLQKSYMPLTIVTLLHRLQPMILK